MDVQKSAHPFYYISCSVYVNVFGTAMNMLRYPIIVLWPHDLIFRFLLLYISRHLSKCL